MIDLRTYNEHMQALTTALSELSSRVRQLEAVQIPMGGVLGPHDILSLTHPDSTPAAVVRGDMITGQGLVPTWTRLAAGGANTVLTSDGTDLTWQATAAVNHNLLSATHGDTTVQAVSRGSVVTGQGAVPTWNELVLGGITGSIITRDATDVLWSTFALAGTAGQTYTFPAVSGGVALGAGTLTAATGNDATIANHTHAITNTSDGDTTPSTILAANADGGLRLDRLGINIAIPIPTWSKLQVQGTSASRYTAYVEGVYTPLFGETSTAIYGLSLVTGSNGLVCGVLGYARQCGISAVSDLVGGFFIADALVSFNGNVTNAYGGRFEVQSNHGGTFSNCYAGHFRVNSIDSSVVTNAYGVFVQSPYISGGGAIGTAYGLYIAAQTGAGGNYAIVTNDGNIVFNETGDASTDFRVEGDTLTHLLFADAGEDAVGIGYASLAGATGEFLVNGTVGIGTIAPDRILHTEVADAVTNAITYATRTSHTTSGTAAALYGVGHEDELEDAAGNMQVASEQTTLWAAATSGSESPLLRITTYPAGTAGPGYSGHWTWTGVDGTARTLIPNGTGDVTGILEALFAVVESAGGTAAGNISAVPGGAVATLYTDGVDTLDLAVAANGSVTVQRTAGAATFSVSLWMTWI